MFAEYEQFDGLGLAELVRNGEVSAAELLQTAQELTRARNPALNAVVRELPELAREWLGSHPKDAPFAGVPFLLKDLLCHVQGTVMASGCAALRGYVSDRDSELARRFRGAGLIVFGRTNTPELGLMGITEPKAFGPTRNPWDLSRTPGGSSGGSAAAVAAGIVPMAHGGDGGGSLRIPASCCGLFALKPSRGRTPTGPHLGEGWDGAGVEHVLTRSVRDSAAMLDAIAGPEPGMPWPVAAPELSYLEASQRDPEPLRIALSTRAPLGPGPSAECLRAVEDAAALLASLGHEVTEDEPALDGRVLMRAFLTMYMGQTAAELVEISRVTGVPPSKLDVEPSTRALARLGNALSARDYVVMRHSWNDLARAMGAFHQRYDLLLMPTLADVPQPVGSLYPRRYQERIMSLTALPGFSKAALRLGALDAMAEEALAKTPYTQLANLTGQPAMSVPLHWSEEGLPVGVQFVAPLGREERLFRLAGQLERARPGWARPQGRGLD